MMNKLNKIKYWLYGKGQRQFVKNTLSMMPKYKPEPLVSQNFKPLTSAQIKTKSGLSRRMALQLSLKKNIYTLITFSITQVT